VRYRTAQQSRYVERMGAVRREIALVVAGLRAEPPHVQRRAVAITFLVVFSTILIGAALGEVAVALLG
jgi:hypothetical protein